MVETQKGLCLLTLNQYAYVEKGKTINLSGQLEAFKNKVDDKSRKVRGTQCIMTLDGYVVPLQMRAGLAYLDMHPPSDNELEISHIVLI